VDVDLIIGEHGENVPVNATDIVADQGVFGYTTTNLAVYLSLPRVQPVTWDGMNQDVIHSVIMEEHQTVTLVAVLLDFTVHVVDFVRIYNYNLFCVILNLNFL
jgi:hypothetical protein